MTNKTGTSYAQNNPYAINVIVKNKLATVYQHDGDFYIEGRKGSEYELELINNSYRDAEFVVSIDGLSITTGKAAGAETTGYIVPLRSRARISGWLLNSNKAASFKFGDRNNSYAAQSAEGDVTNSGVIGLRVYPKKYVGPVIPYRYDNQDRYWFSVGGSITHTYDSYNQPMFGSLNTTNSLSSRRSVMRSKTPSKTPEFRKLLSTSTVEASNAAAPSSLGTEFGSEHNFNTTKVEFERASSTPVHERIIYYGNSDDLNRIGIVLDWQKKPTARPNPFPTDSEYCNPPANWKG